MLRAKFIHKGDRIPKDADRVYVGHHTCPAFLHDTQWLCKTDAPLTVVIPPLTPENTELFMLLLRSLENAASPDIELSLNDYGALYIASGSRAVERGASLCAGLLLAGQDTDPSLADYCTGKMQQRRMVYSANGVVELKYAPPPSPLAAHWATPSVLGHIAPLKRMGVSRIELCAQPVPFGNMECELPVTYYENRALVTVVPCCGDCLRCEASACMPNNYVQDKNAIWYTMNTIPPNAADRLVAG